MERCPACRARLGGQTLCPRCGCDLGLALRASSEARRLLGCAIEAWAGGHAERARRQADASLTLHRTPLTVAFVALLRESERMGMSRTG